METVTERAGARILAVDALRGFALFGILVVNIAFFASGFTYQLVADPAFDSWLDHLVRGVVLFAFEMKFYLLFSFLFGYSFTLQLDSAAASGARFTPRFLRRLAGLFVLGAAHAVLLFYGDILTTYAVLGLVLLAMQGIRPRTAVLVAVCLTVAFGVLAGLLGVANLLGTGTSANPGVDQAGALDRGHAMTEALTGSAGSVLALNLQTIPVQLGALAVQGPLALAAFLCGLAAGKRKLLNNFRQETLRKTQLIGFPIGLAGALVFALGGGTSNLLALAASVLTAPLLCAAYVATLLRIFQHGNGKRLAAMLAPAGKLALTNYLGQSLCCALIFTGYGLGLAGTLSPPAVLLIAVAIFCVQVALSRWWLREHRYGPAEWVLRAVTLAGKP